MVDPLAHLVEHYTFNVVVPRSSRGWVTISYRLLDASRYGANGGNDRQRPAQGRVAELADAQDLGSCTARCRGSTPLSCIFDEIHAPRNRDDVGAALASRVRLRGHALDQLDGG